jgi:predicted MFS family arabinose efflux permease
VQNVEHRTGGGGLLTVVGAPIIGRLADRSGKLLIYRIVASVSMVLMLVVTSSIADRGV